MIPSSAGSDSTEQLAELKARMKAFIDEEVIPREASLLSDDTGSVMADLKSKAKTAGLWALGHPLELGGGGLPFMAFAQLNEIIGRSYFGQMAVGSISMQDSIMLHRYGSEEHRRAWLEPLVAGDIYP
ncbi:MAG: acyl-CoA dehydrogenase family protein, partial [Luminiphilus sp.]|nr:acyl-CoA dehydrogenase family protein [Luminiphilus sp.]